MLGAINNVWKVPFCAIWEAFLAKFDLHAYAVGYIVSFLPPIPKLKYGFAPLDPMQ